MTNFNEKELEIIEKARGLQLLGTRQDDLLSQLKDLMIVGNAFGLYDAVDYIYNQAVSKEKSSYEWFLVNRKVWRSVV